MKNQKITETTWFKNVVIIAILFIPFLYSFFYLKAYWDPYGEGNMDNIPVAIVNEDKGDKGKSLVDKLIDSKVLKFNITSKAEAKTGLNNKKYYAVISIPSDFTNNLKSANEDEKIPATITYSPNQKTNYLASQIISRVVLTVEKEVRSEVSETVVKNLSDKLIQVPKKKV
jgi:putative membrane protein